MATLLSEFFLNGGMALVVQVLSIAAFLLCALLYLAKKYELLRPAAKTSAFGLIGLRLFYGIAAAISQHYAWSQSDFTRTFLDEKLPAWFFHPFLGKFYVFFDNPRGYFLYYSFTHFFLNALITAAAALVFYGFLRLLKRYQERFFEVGEVELGFLAAFVAGWPGFVLFVPLAFVAVILVSVLRAVIFREPYTTLGYPFLLSAAVVLLWGGVLMPLFHLGALSV